MEIHSLPSTVEEFRQWRDSVAGTPEGGAAAFAVALTVFAEDPVLGIQLLTMALDAGQLSSGTEGIGGRQPARLRDFKDRNGRNPHIARSMFQGTSPEAGYALPPFPLIIKFKDSPAAPAGDETKIFIYTTGAPSPKPLSLKRNDKGMWKATEWSSFQGNCRAPVIARPDDL